MSAVVKTGNATHDNNVVVAAAKAQAAATPTATKAAVVAAETTFYQTVAKSAVANNCGVSQFLTTLKELGKDLYS